MNYLPLLLISSVIATACGDNNEQPRTGVSTPALKDCTNGKHDVLDFVGEPVQAAVVDVANTEPAGIFALFFDMDAVKELAKARQEAPFDTIVEVACVPGIGPSALEDLQGISLGRCGLGDSVAAKADATPRSCAMWAAACGNEPFRETGPIQRECASPAPVGTFVREPVDIAEAPGLPVELTFEDGRYQATYADGTVEEGRAQQHDKQRGEDGLLTYMALRVDEGEFADFSFFHMELAEGGDSLTLNPLLGPIGRDIAAPVFTQKD